MNELVSNLERIGLSQYLENFVEEGFDTWETVLYITESDLDALGVRLGHRRRLQKEIAQARNIGFESLIPQIGPIGFLEPVHNVEGSGPPNSVTLENPIVLPRPVAKRKYRRHPKPDENAPERPPSAYVIFSNAIREEVKTQKLSFTEIAKTVGERWQNLALEEKKLYESEAATSKEQYNERLSRYKRTDEYGQYQHYLSDFKLKNSAVSNEHKRPKMEKDLGSGSSGSGGSVSSGLSTSQGFGGHFNQYKRKNDSASGYGQSPGGSVHGSPIPALPRVTSQASAEASSPSSTSTTPITTSAHRLSTGSHATSGLLTNLQSLPRIVPLELARESAAATTSTNLPPLISDPPRIPYSSRRTDNTPHASLLHHDTSRSSMSSTKSSDASTNSSNFTPVTPIDDGRPPVSPPSQSKPLNALAHEARPQPWATHSQLAGHEHRFSQQKSEVRPNPLMSRLTISGDYNTEITRHRQLEPVPQHHRDHESHGGAPSSTGTMYYESPNDSAEAPQGGLDALSVLALAGHMIAEKKVEGEEASFKRDVS